MQDKGLDFKHKEVVNITDGKRLGYVQDVCADLETGVITSIIVPGSNKIMNIFASNNDIVIPWKNIKCIGDDLILVEIWIVLSNTKKYWKISQLFLKKVLTLNCEYAIINKHLGRIENSLKINKNNLNFFKKTIDKIRQDMLL